MPSMSSQELRHHAVKISRLHRCWYEGKVEPKRVRRHLFATHEHAPQAQFIPGGDWILVATDHTLQLYQAQNIEEPCVVVLLSSLMSNVSNQCCALLSVSVSSCQEIRAVVVHSYLDAA
jgi:hypothetical protein